MIGHPLPRGATVFIEAHSQYRGPLLGIARRLREEHDARIHLFVTTPQQAEHYGRWDRDGVFAAITLNNAVYETCREAVPDADAVWREAAANEADLGATYNEIALTDRHLGRGFALGGFRHPRSSISEDTSLVQMAAGIGAGIAFWRDQIERHRPSLIVSGGKIVNLVARGAGVPVRVLAGSRYRNYHYWGHNEFFENPAVEAAYRTALPDPQLALEAPYDAHLRFRAIFRKEGSRWSALKRTGRLVLQQAYWRLRRYQKGRGYRLSENIAMFWRRQRDIRAMIDGDRPSLGDLAGERFVYYPLHTEPETALQMLSPECFAQLAVIAALARDLPAGCRLAVKETFAAVGRRPRDFYGQIAEFKNVVLLNMEELGLDVARTAAATATITGTGGFEAAVLGRPVVTWGRRNLYNILPHVHVVTDERQLKDYLGRALGPGFDADKARHDGARFLAAVVATSFDLEDFSPAASDRISDTAVEAAYNALVDSLAPKAEDLRLPASA